MIQRPRRLSDGAVFDPLGLSVTLTADGTPTAQMTLRPEDEIGMHDILELWTVQGSAGLFRVTSRAVSYGDQVSVTLAGAVDTLTDDVYPTTQEITGEVSTVLGTILAQQTVTRWQLGTCAASGNVKLSCTYTDLWSLMEAARNSFKGYVWTFDYTTTPWSMSLVQLPGTLSAELRIGRNLESITLDISDAEMCTRLYMTVTNPTTGASTLGVYDNAAAQAKYGVIVKTADVSTEDAPVPADYAAAILAERAEPVAYISVSGEDLHAITGDDFDKIALGSLCRVILPGVGTLTETVKSITFPDALGEPEKMTFSLANNLKPFAETLSTMRRTGSGTAEKVEKQEQELVRHRADIDKDNERILLWATEEEWDEIEEEWIETGKSQLEITSARIESKVSNGTYQSYITQTANKIALVVGGTDANPTVNTASILMAINGDGTTSTAIKADKVLIDGSTTLNGTMEIDGDGVLRVKKNLIVNGTNGRQVSINNGTISTNDLAVKSGGSVTFVGTASGEHYDLTASNLPNFIRKAAVSGNTLQLWKLTDADASPSITFSKATALSGAWGSGADSGTFIVTATQGGAQVGIVTESPQIRLNGNGSDSFSAEMLDEYGIAVRKTIYGYLHQTGNYVNVYGSRSGSTYSDMVASLYVPPVSAALGPLEIYPNPGDDLHIYAADDDLDGYDEVLIHVSGGGGGSYTFSCAEQAATWTQSISGYLYCGAISKSSVSANAYLRFRIKCDNAYKYCYITVNP